MKARSTADGSLAGSVKRRRVALRARASSQCSYLPLLLVLLGDVACGSRPNAGPPPPPLIAKPLASASSTAPDASEQRDTPALDATLIANVPEGTFGPYIGGPTVDGKNLALWAAPNDEGARRWYSLVLDAKGIPLTEARDLGAAPGALALARVRSTAQGFVALATQPGEDGTRIETLSIGRSGELSHGPITVAQSRTDVLWVEALRVGNETIAVWAALAAGSADINVAPIRPDQTPLPAARVLEDARAWQAIEFGDGLAIAAILGDGDAAARTLRVVFVGADGRTLAQTDVRRSTAIGSELDAARVDDRLLLAWVERQGLEDRVHVAALGTDARITAPPAAAAPFGHQRLIQMVPGAERRAEAFLVWENVDQGVGAERALNVARVSANGAVDARRAELSFAGGADQRMEIVTRGGGLAALTRAPLCRKGPEPCSAPATAAFVELDEAFAVLASEPVLLGPESGSPADLAWGLTCSADACSALAAMTRSPVPVYGVELRPRSDLWRPLAAALPEGSPRVLRMEAVAETEPLADVAAAPLGDRLMVATLAQFDESTPYVKRTTPAPDGRMAPLRARLSLQPFGPDGNPVGAAHIVSYRARSTGGIALASAAADRALLAWTALDKQRPEVFATLVGRGGQALAQRMLTLGAGDVTAVAAGSLPLGYLVAWIAERGGEPQITVTRLNSDLGRAGVERQLSQSPGGARALSLLVRGPETWLAWVQANDREQVLWLSRLDSRTLSSLADDVAVQRSPAGTLRSAVLVARGEGALLGWIAQPAVGAADGSRAWLVDVARDGRLGGDPKPIVAGLEDPTAIRVYCTDLACQGVIDSRPPSQYLLTGFDWSPTAGAGAAHRLARRASATGDPAAFALIDAHVFYADRQRQRGLLRHLETSWR